MAQRNKKYDRQLRIWGETGQEALEQANVCLLNCGPTGAEALKNLVLGGIGSYTVVDATKVKVFDLGNNFLVDWDALGRSKAQTVCTFLQELNEFVGAKFLEESPQVLIDSNPGFFSEFTVIIATQMPESSLVKLDMICRQYNVILLAAHSYGLTGIIRVSVKEHDVIESKPDSKVEDLRLHKPWPELKKYVDEFDIETKDPLVHKHIPFAVLLIKIAEDWRQDHCGHLPSSLHELKAAVNARKYSEDEDNYKEALKAAYLVLSPPGIKLELCKVLEDKAAEVDASSPDFWIMVAALKLFMANEGEGEPPLEGSLPDMHSFTLYYIGLQKTYRAKAEADITAVEVRVRSILNQLGRDMDSIHRTTIKHFCRNSRNLQVLRYRPIVNELGSPADLEFQKLLTAGNSRNAELYILLRGVDHFAEMYNRYPGVCDEEFDEDISRLKFLAANVLNEMGLAGVKLPDELITEFCRFGAAELHCVASVIGGMAAQEVIKLLTRQFTPIRGALVYNAINATSIVLNCQAS